MGVSRIRVHIDRLVLNGFSSLEGQAVAEALQAQLSQGLADAASRQDWARSHRTPVLKLGRIPFTSGPSGSRSFGTRVGGAIGKGLKP